MVRRIRRTSLLQVLTGKNREHLRESVLPAPNRMPRLRTPVQSVHVVIQRHDT